ncbi:hypothetical protein [Aureicoccus marinus]|nr:hypothetical protein [Aureicoccus marinus]
MNLRSRVRMIIETDFKPTVANNQIVSEKRGRSTRYLFNELGYKLTVTNNYENGLPYMLYTYTYQSNNKKQLKELKAYEYNNSGKQFLYDRVVYQNYDNSGFAGLVWGLIEDKYDRDNKFYSKRKYRMNRMWLPTEVETLESTLGYKGARSYYKYDEQGNKTQYSYYGSGGGRIQFQKFQYNSRNQLIKSLDYNRNGTLSSFYTVSYNTKGDIITKKFFDSSDVVYRTESYTYKYDTKGNWTRRIKSIDGKPTEIHSRTIEYY